MEKLERMKELVEKLNYASKMYYHYSTPIMTDFEYDKLYDELERLEKETNTVLASSPTINVEPEAKTELKKVEHPAPMLSLSKTKSVGDLEEFLSDKEGLLSWKLDGLTIVLTYENGSLVSGVTRGNGVVGEDITENVKQFKNIPLKLPFKEKLVLRGEAIITYSDFKQMNENSSSLEQYKNPRNLCSGSVRQLDSKITKERNVKCIIFTLISGKEFTKKSDAFLWLDKLGFETVYSVEVNKENIEKEVLKFKERVKTYDIPSDGLVLTYNDVKYSLSLGTTAKFPKHSVAFKWKDETMETTLLSVDWNVSRTGLINPIAVFSPVTLEGTVVSRASLHNVSILRGLKLGVGDQILVYKANMIIPQVAENLTKSDNLEIPEICPVCSHKTKLENTNDVLYLYCTNEFCKAKFIKKLSLFVSRNAMNIDGISDAILEKLIEEKIIDKYVDIYHLSKYKEKIINFEGFGEKSYNNLIKEIELSRNVKVANFIYALGIKEIGLSRAKLICQKYNNDFDVIRNLKLEDLSNIDGVGEIIALNFIEYFNSKEANEEIDLLLKEITFIDKNKKQENKFFNKVFVITGKLNNFNNRDEMIDYIELNGGKVVSAISSNVDYLINNDVNSLSTKNKRAKELNVKIISEEEFMKGNL